MNDDRDPLADFERGPNSDPKAIFDATAEDPRAAAAAELDARASGLSAGFRRAIPFLFRDGVAVTPDRAEATSLEALEAELTSPRHLVLLKTEPDGSPAAIVLDAAAVGFLLDGALGGNGTSPPELGPEGLTGPQRALLGRILAGVLPAFATALDGGSGLRLKKPALGEPPARPGPVIALRFRLGEGGAAGIVVLALAEEALAGCAGSAKKAQSLDSVVATALGAVELELVVELGRLRMTLSELAALRVGDVLPLATTVGSAVPVRADGHVLLRGLPTTSGSQVAVKVAATVAETVGAG